ncbi:MAG: Dam family site-specific DNA-(adenine-N6)-methyltransferase, partial [archaeon]|nr:Dam family site-specific DNA-(adenine-N6)-methyltransferase [archaeon]
MIKKWREENRKKSKISNIPHPFIKWVGGKRQLIPQIDKFIPKRFNNYIEPFVGGGALFFYLLPENAILIDNNPELINCYNVIQNNVENLIQSLKKHKNEKEYFYEVRSFDRNAEKFAKFSDVEKASRTIFLNKTCYNGLYRVNK